jgi:hypothetical protein
MSGKIAGFQRSFSMTLLDRHDWPGYSMMKDFTHSSKLIDREQQRYVGLANDE